MGAGFTFCNLIIQELLRAKQELKLTGCLKKLCKYDAVILDDMVPPGRIRYPPAFGMHCQAILGGGETGKILVVDENK